MQIITDREKTNELPQTFKSLARGWETPGHTFFGEVSFGRNQRSTYSGQITIKLITDESYVVTTPNNSYRADFTTYSKWEITRNDANEHLIAAKLKYNASIEDIVTLRVIKEL